MKRPSPAEIRRLPITYANEEADRRSLVDISDRAWREEAICLQTDPAVFFVEKGESTVEAKRTCLGCPVRVQCLAYALENDEHFGVWGGLSERERRRLKRVAS